VDEACVAGSEIIQIAGFFIVHCKFETGAGNHFSSGKKKKKKKKRVRQMHPFSYKL